MLRWKLTLVLGVAWLSSQGAAFGQTIPNPFAPPQGSLFERMRLDGGLTAQLHTVRLHADGNLVGRLRVPSGGESMSPALIRVFFVHHGGLVTQTLSNVDGNFMAVGLPPSIYTVIVAGNEGFSAFSVRVLPFDESAEESAMLLDIVAVPTSNYMALSEILRATYPTLGQQAR